MTDDISVRLDASGLSGGLAAAGTEISRLAREEIAPAAAVIEDAFAGAAVSIERSLVRAARSGSLSLDGLARSIAGNLRRTAVDSLVRRPVEALLRNALTAPFGGGRGFGGAVAPGARYLVGERGPEIFTPSVSGRIAGAGQAGVTVNIALPGVADAESFRMSETQIAAALSRALARGGRNL